MLRRLHREFNNRRRHALADALAEIGVADPQLTATAMAGTVLYGRVMSGRPLNPDRAADLVATLAGPDQVSA